MQGHTCAQFCTIGYDTTRHDTNISYRRNTQLQLCTSQCVRYRTLRHLRQQGPAAMLDHAWSRESREHVRYNTEIQSFQTITYHVYLYVTCPSVCGVVRYLQNRTFSNPVVLVAEETSRHGCLCVE